MNNIILNSKCYCKKALTYYKNDVIMMLPCEHLLHLKCYELTNKKICYICEKKIISTFKLSDYKKFNEKEKSIYLQRYIDVLSMTNFDNLSSYDITKSIQNIPAMMHILGSLPFLKGFDDGLSLVTNILSMNNIKIKVLGMKKIQSGPKVFIANHTCYLDFLTSYYITKAGFLSSIEIKATSIGRQLLEIVPILLIDRGIKSNTVEKMREYVKTYGSICIFPEGMQTHPKTIINFRTGAFNIGYPIYSLVMDYDPPLADMEIKDFILKIMSGSTINIKVKILGPYLPPFNDTDIKNIRYDMAKAGHMFLSRVSNKDLEEIIK